MQKRKIVKKNNLREPRRARAQPTRKITVEVAKAIDDAWDRAEEEATKALIEKGNPKFPVTIYFFNRPLLYKAFTNIAEEKGIELRKLILSFASLGLKAYLKGTGRAFKD